MSSKGLDAKTDMMLAGLVGITISISIIIVSFLQGEMLPVGIFSVILFVSAGFLYKSKDMS